MVRGSTVGTKGKERTTVENTSKEMGLNSNLLWVWLCHSTPPTSSNVPSMCWYYSHPKGTQ